MDRITPEKRSWVMSRVKAKHSSAEMRVRHIAHSLGLRYRLHRHDLPGSPDLVFPRHRAVIFVHGCFWHRHPGCKRASTPKSQVTYWMDKFERNVARDRQAVIDLRALGWRVLVIWECETKSSKLVLQRLGELFEVSP
ncbi:MAG: very short patch repair endonuclease [Deltaproteobacteria bacterium]|nr:very short patch repair endonuclease [bacterium]MDE0344051.1 very short patch repair endonuclease [Deltaproteobacteria bacterium]